MKHFNPFPELIFNFIGVVNEIRKDIITNNSRAKRPIHLAPSLMISGKPNKQTERIRYSLEERYCINIIYDLFDSGSQTFSGFGVSSLKTTGKNQPLTNKAQWANLVIRQFQCREAISSTSKTRYARWAYLKHI